MEMNKCFDSQRLFYRPFQMDDAQTMYRYNNEESRRRWFYFQEPDCLTLNFCIKGIAENMELWSRKLNILEDHFDFAVVLKETGEYIGNVGISKAQREDAEIGYGICEAHQGNGYATEAVKAAVAWGFARLRELGAERKIVGKVEHENWSSRRVLEKAAFAFSHAEKYLSVYELREE